MAGETTITVVGSLVADPELRFTFGRRRRFLPDRVHPRSFDKNTNEWKDGESLFLTCSVWRQYAENVAESLTKGTRVIVTGRLKQRSYETREGEKRTVFEIDVDDVGPALKNATAKVNRISRDGGGFSGWRWQQQRRRRIRRGDDPWSTPPSSEAPVPDPPSPPGVSRPDLGAPAGPQAADPAPDPQSPVSSARTSPADRLQGHRAAA